ncbi:MAG: NADH-quinone oxidoreductase subunit N [Candidatus Didemnitutus sp.]|nr:NADH-quinone oxidoreductase subunit N [Candidatus Didemnitutus sp.]
MNLSYAELFRAMLPETALVLGALAVLGLDMILGRGKTSEQRLRRSVYVGLGAIVAAVYGALGAGATGPVFGGVLFLDQLTLVTRLGVLVLTGLTLGLLNGVIRQRHPAEYVAVILLAASGFTLMAAAHQLLIAFLAIELASLSLYVLAGFDKTKPESAEAALKYFLVGGMSAAFLLFGFSLIYGLTGALDFREISIRLALQGTSPLLIIALVMIIVAFGFKAAAAPFHLWAPDVYQGAPASSTALIASASKLAGFVIFMRLLWGAAPLSAGRIGEMPLYVGWLPVLALLAFASMFLGNFAALAQSNVRRLLAYSAIAHAGSILLGITAARYAGPGPVFYYAATYGLATVGIFGVLAIVERAGQCQQITDLAGLHRRSPLLAGCLAVFVLSLAGIPPLAGFFGKFAVYASVLQLGGVSGPAGWLTIAAIALSALALYYYLLILKQALVANPAVDAPPIQVPLQAGLVLLGSAAGLLFLGVFPSVVLRLFS